MARIKLNNAKRDLIYEYMKEKLKASLDDSKIREVELECANVFNETVRKRYSETDMAVLRKFELTIEDKCLRFSEDDTGRVYQVNLGKFKLPEDFKIAEVPYRKNCGSYGSTSGSNIIAAPKKLGKLTDKAEKLRDEFNTQYREKKTQYRSFVNSCVYIDEVEAVVVLPEDLRRRVGGESNSLVVINPDIIAAIKKDFKA